MGLLLLFFDIILINIYIYISPLHCLYLNALKKKSFKLHAVSFLIIKFILQPFFKNMT